MSTEERLNRIVAKCRELLAIAEKRTSGKWIFETVTTSCGVCHKVGPFPWREGKMNHACIYVDYPSPGPLDTELKANAAFIAYCAGPAEAGWRATIAAIEFLKCGRFFESNIADEIVAAWPEELL